MFSLHSFVNLEVLVRYKIASYWFENCIMNTAVHVIILKMILQGVFDAFKMKSVKICASHLPA